MDSPDENNSIDDFALEMLRRAKERKQVISGKLRQEHESADPDQSIDIIMEKLEKKSSASSIASPTKAKLDSPVKLGGTRPILKQLSTNDSIEGSENMPRKVSLKKSVTTCDAMTGDTIVEAKTFISEGEEDDDEDDDEDVEREEAEQTVTINVKNDMDDDNDNIEELPEDEELDDDEEEANAVKSVLTTPQLSKTLSKLSEFHSNKEVDSPVHRHTCLETFNEGNPDDAAEVVHVSASRNARTSRLSALARTINDWEDDTSHVSIPGSRFHENPPASNNRASLAGKSRYSSASSPSASSPLSLGSGRQGQITGVRLFHKKTNSNLDNGSKSNGRKSSRNSGGGQYGEGARANGNSSLESSTRLGFEQTVLTKLQSKLNEKTQNQADDDSVVQKSNDDWDEALMKSLELQGFSRRQGSPLKQIREQTPERSQKEASPKKTYFGGSPFKSTPPTTQAQVNSPSSRSSPAKPARVSSPVKSASPAPASSPMHSVVASNNNLRSRRSPSPMKSTGYGGSPLRGGKPLNEPAGKPVSAIRMRFEGGSGGGGAVSQGKPGPVKPDRTRFKPYTHTPTNAGGNIYKSSYASSSSSSSSPVKKYNFGESDRDPSSLSVAERAKLFERSKFAVAAPKKPVTTEAHQPKTHNIFTSSPRADNFKPQEIDVSSVVPPTAEQEFMSPTKKRLAPLPPAVSSHVTSSPNSYGKGPAPPPPPPMPTTSTPTNAHSKRRSTSPARSFPKEQHSVKRIKVNAPKPGNMYPSLTDIETETETEGHCTDDVDSMDDSIGSEQSLGAAIETIAKSCSPIRAAAGGRIPSRYRPSEDFSATFACAAVDAFIDEALEGQDMTGTTMNFSTTMCETPKFTRGLEHVSESDSASFERTVVSVDKSADMLCTSAQSDSLDETPSEPDILEDAQEVSCSEADTTASSSFTTSPASLSKLNTNADAVAVNNVEHVESEMPTAAQNRFIVKRVDPQPSEEDFVPRTLTHTVSFYRKTQQHQKKNEACAGLNDISEQAEGSESSDEDVRVEKPNIGQLIRKLENEVEGRNSSIAQASKALNWCKALVGFSDSTEYIECERILLIETQRRLALLNSIHRLKTEGAIGREMPAVFSPSKQDVTPSCKGNMNISNIAVTLKREYFTAHRAENQYHFIGLVKNKHHIEHTTLLTYDSQKQGSTLRFPNDFVLEGLDPDFQINLEIYYLESAKEFLPHEAKYRINAKKDNKQATMLLSPLLTPSKKGGKNDHHKSHHHIQSPAGPDTVKSSSFKYCGGLFIDISSLQRTYWELDKAAGPLSGGISIKVQCSAMGGVEHKGFLTLFEDVSGYGAWVRRWCRLGPAVLEFWKYPEDETEGRKPPLGTLNLHECVTSRVRPAPRDVCARANTLLLVTTRAPHPNDKDTLVTSCHKGYTAVRHLISADTREERDGWCQQLNKALANLRAWDPVAKQSVDDNLF